VNDDGEEFSIAVEGLCSHVRKSGADAWGEAVRPISGRTWLLSCGLPPREYEQESKGCLLGRIATIFRHFMLINAVLCVDI
jgi:hypothetical protein